MFTLIITLIVIVAAGIAGFFAGAKHAEKANALKALIKG
jgi:hypothetical protein